MAKLLEMLYLIAEILKLVKDTDGDGRPDLFDDDPLDPQVK